MPYATEDEVEARAAALRPCTGATPLSCSTPLKSPTTRASCSTRDSSHQWLLALAGLPLPGQGQCLASPCPHNPGVPALQRVEVPGLPGCHFTEHGPTSFVKIRFACTFTRDLYARTLSCPHIGSLQMRWPMRHSGGQGHPYGPALSQVFPLSSATEQVAQAIESRRPRSPMRPAKGQ